MNGGDPLEVTKRHPTIVLAQVESSADLSRLVRGLDADHGDSSFVAVLSADQLVDADELVHELMPVVREFVFTDSDADSDHPGSGHDLAMRALAEFGVGQDFVYTVPSLVDAIDYTVDALRAPGRHGWEGDAVLIVGPARVIEQARRHLR